MTAIDRTAYPRPGALLTVEELDIRYHLNDADLFFVRDKAFSDAGRLTLAVLLKGRQDLGYFPAPCAVHVSTVTHLAAQLDLASATPMLDEARQKTMLHRHRTAVRRHLDVLPFSETAGQMISATVLAAAEMMSDPADLINRAIETLGKAMIDLPAFSTLDRLVNHLRTQVHTRMYKQVMARLTPDIARVLDELLTVPEGATTTPFNRLKQTPGTARPETIRLWTKRLNWLTSLVDPDPLLDGISHTKLRQFASEARALEVSELRAITQPGRCYILILCLLRQVRAQCRDELIEMLLRRVRKTQAAAKERLKVLQEQHRGIEEKLVGVLGEVLETAKDSDSDTNVGKRIRALLARQGGIEALSEQCETVSAWHNNNDLPLLWPIHAKTRSLLFRLLEQMDIHSATQDCSLLEALSVVIEHRTARRDELDGQLDLNFASQRWRNFVTKRHRDGVVIDRRALEVCVFIHLAAALQAGDIFVIGADTFDDYRTQLLPWPDCEARLAHYCEALGLPKSGDQLVTQLRQELTATVVAVDAGFPSNADSPAKSTGA